MPIDNLVHYALKVLVLGRSILVLEYHSGVSDICWGPTKIQLYAQQLLCVSAGPEQMVYRNLKAPSNGAQVNHL